MNAQLSKKTIKQAQALLIATGHTGNGYLFATGHLDDDTRAALQVFQSTHDLEATGELDDATLQYMNTHHFRPALALVTEVRPRLKLLQAILILRWYSSYHELVADGQVSAETLEVMLGTIFADNHLLRDSVCIDRPYRATARAETVAADQPTDGTAPGEYQLR